MPARRSPAAMASRARRLLRRAADARVAAQARTYFKPHEVVFFYGVNTPGVRRVAAALWKEVRPAWTARDAIALADQLVRRPEMEAKTVGMLVLARFRREFPPSLLGTAHRWLEGSHCSNWAATDALAMEVLAPLVHGRPNLAPRLAVWSRSPNLWVRRASAVSLVPLARRGALLDLAYEIAARLLGDSEDLIRKANGWLLREAGTTDARRLERFLLAAGPRVPRATLRYAIERWPATKRSLMLAATKSEATAGTRIRRRAIRAPGKETVR